MVVVHCCLTPLKLKIGDTWATFHSFGNRPSSSVFLKRIARGRASSSVAVNKMIGGIPSDPAALLAFRLFNCFFTASVSI